jgi:hypothetical protein
MMPSPGIVCHNAQGSRLGFYCLAVRVLLGRILRFCIAHDDELKAM